MLPNSVPLLDNCFKDKRKNKFSPKLIRTLMIFIIAYFVGFSIALNHANGIMTNASNNNIHITKLIYSTSIPVKLEILDLNKYAKIKNPIDVKSKDMVDVPTTRVLSFSLLKNLKKAVSMP